MRLLMGSEYSSLLPTWTAPSRTSSVPSMAEFDDMNPSMYFDRIGSM